MRKTKRAHLLTIFIALLVSAAVMHAATTLTASPTSVALNYVKGGTLPTSKVNIAPSAGSTSSLYFTVNPATLPAWLQVDKTNGTASVASPVGLTFSPSLVAANSPSGFYSASVEVDSGALSVIIPVSMTVTNAPSTVTATLQILPNSNWTPGTSPPVGVVTVKSTGDPVFFTASTTQSWINLGAATDVAYSWGTSINVTFAQSVFDNPVVGSSLTGTVTVKAGTTTINLPVSISIGQPTATIASVFPKQLPQVIPAASTRTIAVQGTSFVNGMNVRLGGVAGQVVTYNCATFTSGTTDAWCLQSSSQFFLRLSSATLLGAANTSNQLILYLSAGIPAQGGLPAQPGQITIQVVTTPIVSAVTDAASFVQPAAGQFLNVAPYEMLSFFGDNFGVPAAANGVAFNQGRLLNSLTDASSNTLKVHFTDASGNALAADSDGYLLLWTNNQINVLAPSNLPVSAGGQELKASVMVGNVSSIPDNITTFTVVPASPSLLTIGGTQAVVVNADNNVNSSASSAKFGTVIVLYLSGMGNPTAGSAVAGPANLGPLAPGFAGCADPSSFLAAANAYLHTSWLSLDGAVIDTSILGPYAGAPCFDPSTVTIKIGNITLSNAIVANTVQYAGFTPASIAGLYQVNVAIPLSNSASLTGLIPAVPQTGAAAYPIQVSVGGGTSQASVNVYIGK